MELGITRQEAYDIASNTNDGSAVVEKIKIAARNGSISVTINGFLTDDLRKSIREAGFTVVEKDGYPNTYTIKWDKQKESCCGHCCGH